MKISDIFKSFNRRFSTKKASDAEVSELNKFLEKIPREEWDKDHAWNRIQSKMRSEESHGAARQNIDEGGKESYLARYKANRKSYRPAIQFARISFALFLIATVSYLAVNQFSLFQNKTKNLSLQSITTELGNIKQVVLGDGSVVILNAGSTLEISNGFGKGSREVKLTGEAYFEVTHNAKIPFIVHTNKLTVTDFGTVFDIKAFPDEESSSVALIKGKVGVRKKSDNETNGQNILQPGQQYTYNIPANISNIGVFDGQQVTGWKDNVLVFSNTELSKVFKVLERAYGVKFELQDESLNNLKVSANFDQDSFWTVVKALKSLTGLDYKTVGDQEKLKKIIFYKK